MASAEAITSRDRQPHAQSASKPRQTNQRNHRREQFISSLGLHALLFLISAIFTFPFIWLILTSLKPPAEVFQAS